MNRDWNRCLAPFVLFTLSISLLAGLNGDIGTGTLVVSTNAPNATFKLTGPAVYSGSGMYWSMGNVPTGSYTITYGGAAGFIAPAPETRTLAPGAILSFKGTYQPAPGAGSIQVSTNLPAATFWVIGPTVYGGNGIWWIEPNCPPGLYTVTFGAVPGYTTPPPQTLTLSAGGNIAFSGTYTPVPAATGITVVTNLAAATFRLTGPHGYTGGGMLWNVPDCPPGNYTISFGDVFNYVTPPSQTVTLRLGGSVTVHGDYIPMSAQLNISPLALSFDYEVGKALPAAQTIAVSSGSTPRVATATSNVSWLSVTPQQSRTPVNFQAAVNPIGLAAGIYRGQITISGESGYNGAAVLVTLTVQQPPYLVTSASTLSFTYQSGGSLPQAQAFWVTATTRNIPFQYHSTGSSWLTAGGTGTTPLKLSIGVNPANLAPGSYTGSLVFTASDANNSPQTVVVTLTVIGAPPLLSDVAVFNSAYHDTRVAPCSVASIFGANLAQTQAASTTLPIPLTLGGASVKVNGRLAPLYFVSPGQINLQIPCDLTAGTARVEVNNGSASGFTSAHISNMAPGLFLAEEWWAVGQNEDGTLHGYTNPARAGSLMAVYFTGQGPVNHAMATGEPAPMNPLVYSAAPASATLGGRPVELVFVGLTPGAVGLAQLNFRIPADLPPGQYALMLKLGEVTSNPAIVCVK